MSKKIERIYSENRELKKKVAELERILQKKAKQCIECGQPKYHELSIKQVVDLWKSGESAMTNNSLPVEKR